ncbi:hypothetical protein OO17_08780, partial [Rhodopseudomonas palustris]
MWLLRAFRLSIVALPAALALAGCMGRSGPIAAMPRNDLDSMAYGSRGYQQPAYGGGAFAAVASGFSRRGNPPVVYAASPGPASAPRVVPVYEPDYQLDAGDRLRVVVYGQEGLTNTYTIGPG